MDVIDGFISGLSVPAPLAAELNFGEHKRTGLGRVSITLNYELRRHLACPGDLRHPHLPGVRGGVRMRAQK